MGIGQAVGCRLKELCAEKGMTVHHLAKLAGVPASTVYAIVNGKTKDPSILTILTLCQALGISPRTFFQSPLFQQRDSG